MTTDAGNEAMAVEPEPVAMCDVIQRRIAVSDCQDLRTLAADVRRGGAALNAPDPMMRGQKAQVTLVVDRRSPELIARLDADTVAAGNPPLTANGKDGASADSNAVATDPGNVFENAADPAAGGEDQTDGPTPVDIVGKMPGTVEEFAPKVGRFMSAELIGQGFDIRRISPDTASQEIPAGGQATWTWEVTARQEGQRTLTVRTTVEGEVDGRRYPLANSQTVKAVTVKVSAYDRVGDWLDAAPLWLKRVTAILTALGALVGAWFG
jgi:hypothetical protein